MRSSVAKVSWTRWWFHVDFTWLLDFRLPPDRGRPHTSPTDLGSIIYRCSGRALLYAKPVNSLKACLLWLERVVQLFFIA